MVMARQLISKLHRGEEMNETPDYDRELGRITPQDREYAADLVDDIEDFLDDRPGQIEAAAQWIRKVRYEAVMEDRKKRG